MSRLKLLLCNSVNFRSSISQIRGKATVALPGATNQKQVHDEFFSKLSGPPSYPVLKSFPFMKKYDGILDPFKAFGQLKEQYGDYARLELPGSRFCVTFHPEDTQLVFKSDGKFPRATIQGFPAFEKYFSKNQIANIGGLSGEEWKTLRGKLQKHILPPAAAAQYVEGFDEIVQDFSEGAKKNEGDFRNFISKLTFEVINSVLFGKRLGALTGTMVPEDEKFMQNTMSTFSKGNEFRFGLPFWKYFDTPKYKEWAGDLDYIYVRGKVIMDQFLEDFKKDPERYKNSYVGKLLIENKTTLEEIYYNSIGFLFAGIDTTANTLLILFYHLAKFPQVQEKLYQELSQTLKGKTSLDPEISLPYLKMFVKESNRLDPLGLGSIRRIQNDFTFRNGMSVPAGIDVLMCQNLYGFDPNIFERPTELIPERWTEEEKAKRVAAGNLVADHPYMSIPFSFGPRICLGMRIANLELAATISRLVQDYEISLAPNQGEIRRIVKLFTTFDPLPKFVFTPRKK